MLGLAYILLCFSLFWLAMADTNMTVEDSQIIWPSPFPIWSSTATRCSSQGQGHFAYQANMSMSYEFTGTAIYMTISRTSVTGTYTVSVDGNSPSLNDGFHNPSICDTQWGQTGLSFGPHTVTVKLFGHSPQSSDPQNTSSPLYLEIDAFIYTIPDGSSTSTSISPTSTTTTPPATSSKSSLKAAVIAGIVVAIVGSIAAVVAFFSFLRRRKHRRSLTRRLTVLDRDFPSYASQSPPQPDSIYTHPTDSSSDMSLIHLAEPTNAENQGHSQGHRSGSMVARNGEDAPPDYEAPETKSLL